MQTNIRNIDFIRFVLQRAQHVLVEINVRMRCNEAAIYLAIDPFSGRACRNRVKLLMATQPPVMVGGGSGSSFDRMPFSQLKIIVSVYVPLINLLKWQLTHIF